MEAAVAKRGGAETSLAYSRLQDHEIRVLPAVLQKLRIARISEDRVRQMVRHLHQHCIESGDSGNWSLLFADDKKLRRLFGTMNRARRSNQNEWAPMQRLARRAISDLNGIVFCRTCYRGVCPSKDDGQHAGGAARTTVQLGFSTGPNGASGFVVNVFRYSEVDIDQY